MMQVEVREEQDLTGVSKLSGDGVRRKAARWRWSRAAHARLFVNMVPLNLAALKSRRKTQLFGRKSKV